MNTVYLYRLIGPGDCLLYVGVTDDFDERLRRHRSTAFFGHLIRTSECEAFGNREEALEAERIAIGAESPLFNTQHSGQPIPLLLGGVGAHIYALAGRRGVTLRELGRGAGMSRRRLLRVLADPMHSQVTEIGRLAAHLGTTAGELIAEWEAVA